MSETHTAICDICGRESPMKDLKQDASAKPVWSYPEGWSVMVGVVSGWHCSECLEKVKEFVRQMKEAGK